LAKTAPNSYFCLHPTFPLTLGPRIHKRAVIRSDPNKAGDVGVAMIEEKNYEVIYRNESRDRRGDGLRRVDRGRYCPGVA
jgi:hypothetical protein